MGSERNYGLMQPPPDVMARIPKVRQRLEQSASGYVKVLRFGIADRTALKHMLELGEVEKIDSPVGPAYRLVKGETDAEEDS